MIGTITILTITIVSNTIPKRPAYLTLTWLTSYATMQLNIVAVIVQISRVKN